MVKTIAFTGHRPQALGGFNISSAYNQRVVGTLQRLIRHLAARGFQRFICGGALGVDQWAADLVLLEKISNPGLELTLALPFEGFDGKWPLPSRQDFQSQVERADHVLYVSDPGYQAWKMQKRNEWMVDHADLVVAVWNGHPGGTANCVRYAQRTGKPVVYVNPDTDGVLWPREVL